MKTPLILLAAAAFARPLAAQAAAPDNAIIAARDTVWRAWFAYDTALLRRFIPSALAVQQRGGGWGDRAQILGDSRNFSRAGGRLVGLEFQNTKIDRQGPSALVTSLYRTIVESNGRRDTTRGVASELFVLSGATWVNPFWRLDPLPASGRAGLEIPLPDTLGANYAIADSSRGRGTAQDYDALLGNWEFRFQTRRADGSYNDAFSGHWNFDKRPGDGLIEDHWRPDDTSVPMGNSLYTYRVFDAERKVWQMIGASSYGGAVQPGLTWSDGKDRFAIQRSGDGKILSRIRYIRIERDHFLWRSDRSMDGGKTWILDFAAMEAHRIAK
jgi:hypothetical protein